MDEKSLIYVDSDGNVELHIDAQNFDGVDIVIDHISVEPLDEDRNVFGEDTLGYRKREHWHMATLRVRMRSEHIGKAEMLARTRSAKIVPVDGEGRISLPLSAKMLEWLRQTLGDITEKFNPSMIPTVEQLMKAIDRALENHPMVQGSRVMHHLVQAVTFMREYMGYLPGSHQRNFERELRYIERRAEELVLLRDLVRSMKVFAGASMRAQTSSEMFLMLQQWVHRIAQATGDDLWSEDVDT